MSLSDRLSRLRLAILKPLGTKHLAFTGTHQKFLPKSIGPYAKKVPALIVDSIP
jgi:hypothetical protein